MVRFGMIASAKAVMAIGSLALVAQITPVGPTPVIDVVGKVTLDVALVVAVGVLWRAVAAKDVTIAEMTKAKDAVVAEKDKAMIEMVAKVTEAMTLNNRALGEIREMLRTRNSGGGALALERG
jgi:type VI protein secretion system component VasK